VTATHELLKLLEVYRFVTGGKGGRKPLNCPLTLTQHVTSQVVEVWLVKYLEFFLEFYLFLYKLFLVF
jgi:hypothetical protein